MLYPDGSAVQVGDMVLMDDGLTGLVVCLIDNGMVAPSEKEGLKYLGNGIMVDTAEAGWVWYKAGIRKPAKIQ